MAGKKAKGAVGKKAKNTKKTAPKKGKTRADLALVGCPTTVFDGEVVLNDAAYEAFLRVANGGYLLMIDGACSGNFDPQLVRQAYDQFRVRPGQGGRLVCDGFLKDAGNTPVLHVVRVDN